MFQRVHINLWLLSGFVQGHAAPVLYAVWAETGYLKENELLNLRKVDSILEGHPVPVRRWLDSGSSGSESHLFTSNVTRLGGTINMFLQQEIWFLDSKFSAIVVLFPIKYSILLLCI